MNRRKSTFIQRKVDRFVYCLTLKRSEEDGVRSTTSRGCVWTKDEICIGYGSRFKFNRFCVNFCGVGMGETRKFVHLSGSSLFDNDRQVRMS